MNKSAAKKLKRYAKQDELLVVNNAKAFVNTRPLWMRMKIAFMVLIGNW